MREIRIHGRDGQGVVTAAELLSVAAFLDGLRPPGHLSVDGVAGAIAMVPGDI